MLRKAECCCGSCSIEVNAEPVIYGVCHCNDCKKRTGSAFGLSSYFKNENISNLKGETLLYKVQNDNGNQERHFCSKCGSTLFWYADIFNSLTGVAGGCFIDKPLPQPSFTTMNENKCNWVALSKEMETSFTAEDIPNA